MMKRLFSIWCCNFNHLTDIWQSFNKWLLDALHVRLHWTRFYSLVTLHACARTPGVQEWRLASVLDSWLGIPTSMCSRSFLQLLFHPCSDPWLDPLPCHFSEAGLTTNTAHELDSPPRVLAWYRFFFKSQLSMSDVTYDDSKSWAATSMVLHPCIEI